MFQYVMDILSFLCSFISMEVGFLLAQLLGVATKDFLSKLAKKLGCLIMSVNCHLAPENPLTAAYEDGFKALIWLKQLFLGLINDGQTDAILPKSL